MEWCSSDGGLLRYGPDPSLCFTETFIIFLVNVVFILVMGVRLTILRRFPPFDYINMRNAKIMFIVNILSFIIAIFSILIALIAISALSSIFYAISNITIWFIIASTIGAESKRLARWPSNTVIILLVLNLIGHALLASVLYQEGIPQLFFLCGAGSLFCIFSILCIATLKDMFLSAEDVNEEELRRFSIEFTTTSPIRQPAYSGHFFNRLVEAVSMSFSGSTDNNQSVGGRASAATVRRTRLDFTQSEHSWMNMWPFRSSSAGFRNSDFQSLLEEDLMMDPEGDEDAFLQPNQYNNASPHRSSMRSSHSSLLGGGGGSIVGTGSSFTGVGGGAGGHNSSLSGNHNNFAQIESALDRNVQGNFVAVTADKDQDKPRGFVARLFGSSNNSRNNSTNRKGGYHNSSSNSRHGKAGDDDYDDNNDLDYPNGMRDSEISGGRESSISIGGNSSSNVSRSGRVVAQVLEEHRARLAATNPILEPRGHESGMNTGGSNTMNSNNHSSNALGQSNRDQENQMGGGFDSSMYSNTSSLNNGNSNSGSNKNAAALLKNKRSLRVTVQRWGYRAKRGTNIAATNNASNNKVNNNSSYNTANTETEFELITAASGLNNNSNSNNPVTKWVIWRTVSEIYRLHTTMVGFLGDFAPRRPALRSDSAKPHHTTATNNNNHNGVDMMMEDQVDFNADMRALAVYFNALLRVDYHDNSHVPVLLEFLSVPRDFFFATNVSSNTSNANNANSSANSAEDDHANNTGSTSPLSLAAHHNNNPDNNDGKLSPKTAAGDYSPVSGSTNANNHNHPNNNANKSLMDAAHKHQADTNQQEKWRKLMVQMKMKLKPRDIAVRCRLFEGVISGGDIASFLMRVNNNSNVTVTSNNSNTNTADADTNAATNSSSNNSNSAGLVETYEVARDRFEACHIGQELLSCGLLMPICLGFTGDEDPHAHDEDYNFDKDVAEDVSAITDSSLGSAKKTKPNDIATNNNSSNIDSTLTNNHENIPLVFSDLPGFIFRFPGKSATAGSSTLFGSKVTVRVPHMDFADDQEINRPVGRETMTLILGDVGDIAAPSSSNTTTLPDAVANTDHIATTTTVISSSGSGSNQHVIYFVESTHGNDTWQVTRRYREFEQLSRALGKEGIRTDVPLPSKSYVNALAFMSRQAQLDENRRAGLEAYLSSALQAVIDSASASAMRILAQFLDTEYHTLRIP